MAACNRFPLFAHSTSRFFCRISRIPIIYGTLLFQQRHIFNNQRALDHEMDIGSPNIGHLSFLTLSYKTEFYYWELIECFRRLFLGAAIGLVGFGTAFVGVFGLAICFGFIYLHVEFEPYKEPADNELGNALAFSQALLFLVGLLVRANSFDEWLDNVVGMILIALFFMGPIIILLKKTSNELSLLRGFCRSQIAKFCGRFAVPKPEAPKSREESAVEDLSSGASSKLKSKMMAQKLLYAKQGGTGTRKRRKDRKKKKKKKKKTSETGLDGGFDALSTLVLGLAQDGDGDEEGWYPLMDLDNLSPRAARELVVSLDRPPRRRLLERRTASRARLNHFPSVTFDEGRMFSPQASTSSGRLASRNASRLASVDRPPEWFGRQPANDDAEAGAGGFNERAGLGDSTSRVSLEDMESLAVGDYVQWRSADAELPVGTLGRVQVLFPDGDVEVRFAPRGAEAVVFAFPPDRLVRLRGAALQDHWARDKALDAEAAVQAEVRQTLAAKYGAAGAVPVSAMIAAAAAVEPTPRHVLELLRDEHVEEVAYQAEAKAFLAKFLATCGCGPETGALACLEALGVESLLDLRDPELGAEEELAQLPAIGPKKAAQIVELAIGTLVREFV
jgi:hypothetical protein